MIPKWGGNNTLSINVVTEQIESKGLVTDAYLQPDSEIGVTVLNTSGSTYDGIDYKNIRFKATGTDAAQTWAGDEKVYLSGTQGYCYGYYPYSSTATDITQIPVSTSGQVDYMYADPEPVDIASRNATLDMNHALSAIRFALKLGTYTGTGAVTAVSVTGSNVGTSATLNAMNGELSTVTGTGTAINVSKSLTLSNEAKNIDVIVIPTKNSAELTLSVTINGKVYSTTTSAVTVQQGKCHTYTVTINAGELSLSSVKVGDWGYDDSGAPTITAGGYTVTFAGDYEDIAFGDSVSGNTVTIKAINYDGYEVKEVSASSGATLTQSVSGNTRVITFSNITSDVTVTFNGILDWNHLSDGVYAISKNCTPVYVSNATSDCIGVALINSDTGQKLMIEKYENANNAESTTIYTNAAQQLGSAYTYYFSWGGYGFDQNGITSYSQVGGGSTSSYGYLYLDGSELNIDPSTWSSGVLSDFAGKNNSEVIKTITTNGTSTSTTTAPMAYLMNAFNAEDCPSSVNQGFCDWYIPSCGQLGLIWLNKSAINNALTAIGGTTLTADYYWSSSEVNANFGWYVYLYDGNVNRYLKRYNFRLRLVRDL